jgi:hypothetical protein
MNDFNERSGLWGMTEGRDVDMRVLLSRKMDDGRSTYKL